MLVVGLLALAMASDPRPPRPSDEAMLALVAERIPGAVVLESHDRPMPSDLPGAKAFCGVALVDGRRQPFFVYTFWRPQGAEHGNRWSTTLRAQGSTRSLISDHFERLGVSSACPELAVPETAN